MSAIFVKMDFPCITPLGSARCRGMLRTTAQEGDVTEWLTDIDATREPWWWRNPDFRFGASVTDQGGTPSLFDDEPTPQLARQIARYRQNGWLERGQADPADNGWQIATGLDLDRIASHWGITRETGESDAALRKKIQITWHS